MADTPTPKYNRSPEYRAWDNAISYTNEVAQRFLASPPTASKAQLDAAFDRESALFQKWGGPRG